jgi:protein-disulfide isomerase
MSEQGYSTPLVDRIASVLLIAASLAVLLRLATSTFDNVRATGAQAHAINSTAPAVERLRPPQSTQVQFAKSETLGNLDAKVGIVEYVDFECSFCAAFAEDTWPTLRNEYVSRGKLLFVFKQNPLANHRNARNAAASALCAAEQGRLADMHDGLFRQYKQQRGFDTKSLAVALGLDRPMFEKCASAAESKIDHDLTAAKASGISATPSFVLGTVVDGKTVNVERFFVGAEPLSVFRQSVEQLLAQANR